MFLSRNSSLNTKLINEKDRDFELKYKSENRSEDNSFSESITLKNQNKSSITLTTDNGYNWDYAIIMNNPDFEGNKSKNESNHELAVNELLERLIISGLQVYPYKSGDKDEIIIKIRAPLSLLEKYAEETEFKILVDEKYLLNNVDDASNPIPTDISLTDMSPYYYFYMPYNKGKLAGNFFIYI
jgi:hypothetical protein